MYKKACFKKHLEIMTVFIYSSNTIDKTSLELIYKKKPANNIYKIFENHSSQNIYKKACRLYLQNTWKNITIFREVQFKYKSGDISQNNKTFLKIIYKKKPTEHTYKIPGNCYCI